MPLYSIEARSLGVAGIAGHNFWVLRDEHGAALAELHGLATDRTTGRSVPIGTDPQTHSLRVWELAHDAEYAARRGIKATRETYIGEGQPSRVVLQAQAEEVLARWEAAVAAKAPLNAMDLDYPSYGVRLFGGTVNSNSTYRTLGEVMGVQVKDFPGIVEPGVHNRMVEPDAINSLRTHGYPVLTEPTFRASSLDERHIELSPTKDFSAFLDRMVAAGERGDDVMFREMTRTLAGSPQAQELRQEAAATVDRMEQQAEQQQVQQAHSIQQEMPAMRMHR